ncbi:MAG TPA: acyltransferase [Thermomicrobiales bacterium]
MSVQSKLNDTASNEAQETLHNRYIELDAFRGIAALLIVIHHFYLLSRDENNDHLFLGTFVHFLLANLDVSVTLFFTLSGFVIFLPFARAAIDGDPSPSIARFLVRRALRILPLYYIDIFVVWVRSGGGMPDQHIDLLTHLTFTHILWPQYFYGMLDVAWSLGVEVYFYLFLAVIGPYLCRICARLFTQRARIALLTGSLASIWLVSSAYKLWKLNLIGVLPDRPDVYFGPLAQVDTFVAGMIVAVACSALREHSTISTWIVMALRVSGSMLLIFTLLLRHTSATAWVYFGTFAGVSFAFILAATIFQSRESKLRAALSSNTFQFLGLISYSLYLWHRPLLNELPDTSIQSTRNAFIFQLLAFIGVAIIVATISYWCIERPALQWRKSLRRRALTFHPPAISHIGTD